MRVPAWARLILLAALAKTAVGLTAAILHPPPDDPHFPAVFYYLYFLTFGSGAALLLAGGRADRRAVALGGFFLVCASAFARTPIAHFLSVEPLREPWAGLLAAVRGLRPDVFLAYFLWRFVRDFPEAPVSARARRLMRRMVEASAWIGAALFLIGAATFVLHRDPGRVVNRAVRWLVENYDPQDGWSYAYAVLTPLCVAALVALVWKARSAVGAEQRRARLFLQLLSVTLAPIFLIVLLDSIPGVATAINAHPALRRRLLWAGGVFAWLAPYVTAYAALVHHVLDLRLIARRALQHALARYSTMLLAALPLLSMVAYVYLHRGSTVRDLFTGRRVLLLLAGAVLGVAALRYRARLLEAIDRRFFREQYDARQILTVVVQRIRDTRDVGQLAELLCRGIDTALHLTSIALLVDDPRSGALVDPRSRARRLDAASPLAQLVGSASEALAVDLENPRSPLARLPEMDRHWLLDSGFRLIVPILARDGSLLGMIGLGEKKSGLPFLREDKKLLYDIASSAALGIELELKQTSAPIPGPIWHIPDELAPSDPAALALEQAKECSHCGSLYPPYNVFCSTCSRKLDRALVPFVLPGKFRFERRLGSGGMGVVYRGTDLALGRTVAAKTLRRISPEDAMRLRREARTAALVSHPHLAGIYGVETWQGTPMLILEFLEGGTLAQRLENGGLPSLPAIEIGIAVAAALERLHGADILHRDIKPSNIGFTREGVPKLMDLGIARLMWDRRREERGSPGESDAEDSRMTPTSLWAEDGSPLTGSRQLVGTLSYLSPEALTRSPANPTFDLWALSLVLFECLIGRKLFVGASSKQLMARIQFGRIPDLEQLQPDADPVLADFFRSALHRSLAVRPATARELRARLEAVRTHLLGETEGPLG